MTGNKYDRYFISGLSPDIAADPRQVIAGISGDNFEGCHQYFVRWIQPTPVGMEPAKEWSQVGHGTHKHKTPEVVIHLGTDPDNPYDLGGEVVMYMGPEMEKHVITSSTLVYIPADMIHAPWIIKKVTRPWIFITVCQEPHHTEKSFKELTPPEEVDNVVFMDQGYESDELVIQRPAVLRERDKQS